MQRNGKILVVHFKQQNLCSKILSLKMLHKCFYLSVKITEQTIHPPQELFFLSKVPVVHNYVHRNIIVFMEEIIMKVVVMV